MVLPFHILCYICGVTFPDIDMVIILYVIIDMVLPFQILYVIIAMWCYLSRYYML